MYAGRHHNLCNLNRGNRSLIRDSRETACNCSWSTPTRHNSRIATTRRHRPRYMLPGSTWQSTQTPLSILVCVFSSALSPHEKSCFSHTCTPPRDTERQATDSPNRATARPSLHTSFCVFSTLLRCFSMTRVAFSSAKRALVASFSAFWLLSQRRVVSHLPLQPTRPTNALLVKINERH
jgi:hypothetical protein